MGMIRNVGQLVAACVALCGGCGGVVQYAPVVPYCTYRRRGVQQRGANRRGRRRSCAFFFLVDLPLDGANRV
jgi:hypothetical protein